MKFVFPRVAFNFRSVSSRRGILRPSGNLAKRSLLLESLEPRTTMSTTEMIADGAPLPPVPRGNPVGGSPVAGSPLFGPSNIAPAYSSLPGAADTIYLDFTGHVEPIWGAFANADAPVYDIDGDFATFSPAELTNIEEIWAAVAEDYAPFNINVTTVQPSSFADGVALRVVFGGDGAWLGSFVGGVAYKNAFTNGLSNTVWVFTDNTGYGIAKGAADTASHEAGHAFGLEHQSTYDANGNLVDEYSDGNARRAPIMGVGYYSERVTWSNGTSISATTRQNDMAVLARTANGFGFRADDHGNTAAKATPMIATAGAIAADGIITQTKDLDYFLFATGAGSVSLNVTLPAENNLDAVLELRSLSGAVLATAAPTDSDGATLSFTAPAAGFYYAVVKSAGRYGDVGQYTLAGTVVPTVLTPGLQAPTTVSAVADSLTSITVTWNDVPEAARYRIERQVGNGPWLAIRTVNAPVNSIRDRTVVEGQTYSYRVITIASNGGESIPSVAASASTTRPDAPSKLIATVINSGSAVRLTWQDRTANETLYIVERQANPAGGFVGIAKLGPNATSYIDKTVVSGRRYIYRVRAANGFSASPYSNQAIAIVLRTSTARARAGSAAALAPNSTAVQPSTAASTVFDLRSLDQWFGGWDQ